MEELLNPSIFLFIHGFVCLLTTGGKTPDVNSRTYAHIIREQQLRAEEQEVTKFSTISFEFTNLILGQVRLKLAEKAKEGTLKVVSAPSNGEAKTEAPRKRSARWDQTGDADATTPAAPAAPAALVVKKKTWEAETPAVARWDETPARPKGAETPAGGVTPGSRLWDATPGQDDSRKRNRWDETPKTERAGEYTPGFGSGWAETPRADRGSEMIQETPTPSASKRRSRWDETPAIGSATPAGGMTPQTPSLSGAMTPRMTPGGATPIGPKAMAMATPTPGQLVAMTPEQIQVSHGLFYSKSGSNSSRFFRHSDMNEKSTKGTDP